MKRMESRLGKVLLVSGLLASPGAVAAIDGWNRTLGALRCSGFELGCSGCCTLLAVGFGAVQRPVPGVDARPFP